MSGSISGSINSLTLSGGNALTSLSNLTSTVGGITQSIATLGGAFGGSAWQSQLQQGSFSGVNFITRSLSGTYPRKIALHQYPFSDNIWAEDLGAGEKTIEIDCFLSGPSCYSQRDAIIAANEQAGVGTLVHPSLGSIQVQMTNLVITERIGNVIDLKLSFVITPVITVSQLNMLASTNTKSSVLTSALNLQGTLLGNYFNNAGSLISSAESGISTVVKTVTPYANSILTTVNDASRALSAVQGIAQNIAPGLTFGRYGYGNILPQSISLGISNITSTSVNIQNAVSNLMAGSTAARATTIGAVAIFKNAANNL